MSGFDFLLKRLFTIDENLNKEVKQEKKKFNVFDLLLEEESKHFSEEEEADWVDIGEEDKVVYQTPQTKNSTVKDDSIDVLSCA